MAAAEQHTEVAVRGFAVQGAKHEHFRVTCSCGEVFEASARNFAFDAHRAHRIAQGVLKPSRFST